MQGTIYIARHGETTWNADARIQGQQDILLNTNGFRQRSQLFQLLKDAPLQRIYTSALQRTILTAQPLSCHCSCPLIPMADLNELGFGVMEGIPLDGLSDSDQAQWDWWLEDPLTRGFPGGGESYAQLHDRIDSFLEAFRPPDADRAVLIVGHMRTNQMLLQRFLNLELEDALRIRQPNDCVYRLQGDEALQVQHVLLTGELPAPVWRDGIFMASPDAA